MIDGVRANNIPVVFSESTISPDPAQQVTRETGAKYGGVLYVDSLSGRTVRFRPISISCASRPKPSPKAFRNELFRLKPGPVMGNQPGSRAAAFASPAQP